MNRVETRPRVCDTNVGVPRIGLLSWQSGCGNSNQAKEQRMSEPSLPELEEQRDKLKAEYDFLEAAYGLEAPDKNW